MLIVAGQLRAGTGCRSAARAAVHRAAAGDVPRDQPARLRLRGEHVFEVAAAGAARLRAARSGSIPRSPPPRCRLFRDRATRVEPALRRHGRERRGGRRRDLRGAWRAFPSRSSWRPRRIRVLSPAHDARAAGSAAAAPGRLDAGPPRPAAHDRGDDRVEREPAGCRGPRDCSSDLGVFSGDFSLEAVEAVGAGAGWEADALSTARRTLIDNSLVRSRDVGPLALFGMLATVREYALAQLESSPEGERVRAAACRPLHAARSDARRPCCRDRPSWRRSSASAQNATICAPRGGTCSAPARSRRWREWCGVCSCTGGSRGLMPEARGWMDAILATGIAVSDRTRAIALGFSSWVSLWQDRRRRRSAALRGERAAIPSGRRFAQRGARALLARPAHTSVRARPISTVPRSRAGQRSRSSEGARRPWSPWRRSRSAACCSCAAT